MTNHIVCLTLLGVVTGTTMARAQEFSPYFERTGRGAYDLYGDTLLCNAVLDWVIESDPESEWRPQYDKGVAYARGLRAIPTRKR